ncbi:MULTISPECIES: peptide-methionine (S)-S-oxide reductase MsrA [Leptospira]|uniref:Peptide methionine sulfoxide reductase MsrA n=3 Tax=Leptospira santarosai TaxID=28183 RepID=A0AB73N9P3_9LEPT|nr:MULTISPECIES: peptide-methionine (S)-S-oxide reductase MsrA [Leptospira]AVV49083.1 Peptide methionine sulfoxide reductase MsrA [Leptospira santarosai]AVV79706.1 Peptide methionine sulfoxide reductase MsrA [Leptospira santarosai]EKO78120.1 peptide-methionine (S)-S-oxide reductase [Leptospira sp. Fiocruz LV3954]EKR93428.1 peptide-methionine (S)-S-oxide reductase [Leptospira santarosai str. CBC379]EMF92206.1 peptide-methionine (S)-S-oxide reductase [Leptospira santarosai str. ST188]
MEQATLGGGCFWCLEAVYQMAEGVESVVSGYAAGRTKDPDYRSVCSGTTGHAEVVQITFDPKIIGYSEILEIFWISHDPTTLNRQGNDVGTQYRSIILYHSPEQKKQAEQSVQKAGKYFSDPIVTQVETLKEFYPAENYHQNYFRTNPKQAYCHYVIKPKIDKYLKTGFKVRKEGPEIV